MEQPTILKEEKMHLHTVEKIGGTSMNNYEAVRDNIVRNPALKNNIHNRILVVSAYSGITDLLLEHKKTGHPGVFSLFSNSTNGKDWRTMLDKVRQQMFDINASLFKTEDQIDAANQFIAERISDAESCLSDLQRLCNHGHFSLESHLDSVREMLACIGEAHSARNTAHLLSQDGINACFVDLTGWRSPEQISLDERIKQAFSNIDLQSTMPIVTGYAHSEVGLMTHFDRGYSEMTFSRIAVLTEANEAIIHKEFHLSSADPRLVGEDNAVPIGRTNYDVADQLANLGMEAIHPKAAKGLRQNNIPLRVRNTFEPEHYGTLITQDYVSDSPCVEIIAGQKDICAVELFDQDMTGNITEYDHAIIEIFKQFDVMTVAKDINANTITHYVDADIGTLKRITAQLKKRYPDAEISKRIVAIVSAIGSDMQVPGILSKTVNALAEQNISILAIHQSMRQVDMQFIIDEDDYEMAVKSLHRCLVEVHDHGRAICLAS
ncbi:aspartate kinase [Alkalimarinus alittae]|uniref:aspartate kinase n=1 Tax=Alkalimarinus alittae TaxID=2961619 RepID=A0ABY6N114_9ALTE|nr:aspartate kinase [Alkalimarinus alittae]UZE95796.1 aspartate kinase [Alkalimarinus alittae]